jgi:hypothetical protein
MRRFFFFVYLQLIVFRSFGQEAFTSTKYNYSFTIPVGWFKKDIYYNTGIDAKIIDGKGNSFVVSVSSKTNNNTLNDDFTSLSNSDIETQLSTVLHLTGVTVISRSFVNIDKNQFYLIESKADLEKGGSTYSRMYTCYKGKLSITLTATAMDYMRATINPTLDKILQSFKFSSTKATADNNSNNATEQETKDWIISKLNKCVEQDCSLSTLQQMATTHYETKLNNIVFSFEGCSLVIKYRETLKNVTVNNPSSSYSDYIEKIPVYNVDLHFNNLYNNQLYTSVTNYRSDKINFISSIENIQIQQQYQDGRTFEKSSTFSQELCFNFSLEENLYSRLNKAFEHLKVFCPAPKSKEKF